MESVSKGTALINNEMRAFWSSDLKDATSHDASVVVHEAGTSTVKLGLLKQ